MSQAAEYAIERRWADTNPVTAIAKLPLGYKTPVFKRPSARSLEFGTEYADGNLQPLARFLLATGARLEEVTTLRCNHVDRHWKTATLTDTKNGTTRTVTLNDAALEIPKMHGLFTDYIIQAIDRVTGEKRP